ncbi:hypothetical protein LTS18_011749 [Coniosporium uncinatum]|uniref:Uncharacterized protein n=1 Tax=Coniosporium uncinatum TaxID=93489 RepID=A0ACC3DK34_9PEZI|nr:hypothetical protein LTS18_011749 [Coniosporium uncinatum]
MWTTLLQMGELVDTANRVYDPTETRIFVTHASPAREGILNQLSVTLKADFSISAGLHFRYGSSYNEFSVNPTLDHYRGKLAASKASFEDVWQTVKGEVEPAVEENESQKRLLNYAIDIVGKMPSVPNGGNPFGGQAGPGSGQVDESAFKNMWNFNLADAAYGWLVLDVDNGRIGTEMRAQGFNFAHRGGKAPQQQGQAPPTAPSTSTGVNMPPPQQPVRAASGPQVPQQTSQSPRQPAQATPPTGSQQNRAPPTQPARTGPSPVPVVPKEPSKPATPQPAASAGNVNAGTNEKPTPSEPKANGTNGTTAAEKPVEATKPDKPEVHALFIRNVNSEDEAKKLVPEEDQSKIKSIEKKGYAWIVQFSSANEVQDILKRIPRDTQQGKEGAPSARLYRDDFRSNRGGGAGSWQASSRGGAQGGGYRSGGASDSEGGRGRGARGGYRGARGTDRGGRGRGRGGPPGKDGATSSPAAASAAPAGGNSGGD